MAPSVEPVRVVSPDGRARITPDLSPRHTTAHASYVNACTGLSLSSSEISTLLQRMTLQSSVSPTDQDELLVEIPATRPDILHECDIMEDAAIAFGFNNLPDTFPTTNTVAQPLATSKLSDVVRKEWAMAGWVEVLPLILVSTVPSQVHASDAPRKVFTRGELRMDEPAGRRHHSSQNCESQDPRVSSSPHVPPPWPLEDRARKPVPLAAHPDF
jgi:phenylalanyl-tRNA synthetase beta subunit